MSCYMKQPTTALQLKLAPYAAAVDRRRLVGFEKEAGDGLLAGDGRLVVRGEVDRKVVEVAVQVIEGGLEEAKRDEEKEKAAITQQPQPEAQAQASTANGDDVEMRSTQEDEDRKLSERLQREEDSRNSKRAPKAASAASADTIEDGERESEADLRVQLQADYNISDVKRALSALKQQILAAHASSSVSSSSSSSSPPSASSLSSASSSSNPLPASDSDNHAASDAYLASLTLLHKITTNLRTGEDKYRTLKLGNATLATKLAAYPAALDYLRFLGFEEKEERSMRVERLDNVRVERAAVILQRAIEADTPSKEERGFWSLGSVDSAGYSRSRDEVWQRRTAMVTVPVPVAENAAEIAEKKREDRLGVAGGGGGSGAGEAGGRGGAAGSGSERKGDGEELSGKEEKQPSRKRSINTLPSEETNKRRRAVKPQASSSSSTSSSFSSTSPQLLQPPNTSSKVPQRGRARDDFVLKVKRKLADGVSNLCSICRCLCLAAAVKSSSSIVNIGQAAHICAAAVGGPRYDAQQTPEQRRDIDNGIWLCSNHAKLIDSDVSDWPVEKLKRCRSEAEDRTRRALGQPDPAAVPIPLKPAQSRDKCCWQVLLDEVRRKLEPEGGCEQYPVDVPILVQLHRELRNRGTPGQSVPLPDDMRVSEFADVVREPLWQEAYSKDVRPFISARLAHCARCDAQDRTCRTILFKQPIQGRTVLSLFILHYDRSVTLPVGPVPGSAHLYPPLGGVGVHRLHVRVSNSDLAGHRRCTRDGRQVSGGAEETFTRTRYW